jgi:transcriptional regulatory protein LevR
MTEEQAKRMIELLEKVVVLLEGQIDVSVNNEVRVEGYVSCSGGNLR